MVKRIAKRNVVLNAIPQEVQHLRDCVSAIQVLLLYPVIESIDCKKDVFVAIYIANPIFFDGLRFGPAVIRAHNLTYLRILLFILLSRSFMEVPSSTLPT